MLRSDNADLRLTKKGYDYGCVGQERYRKFASFKSKYDEGIDYLKSIVKSTRAWKELIKDAKMHVSTANKSIFDLLNNPTIDAGQLCAFMDERFHYVIKDSMLLERVRTHALYDACENLQKNEIEEIRMNESIALPQDLNLSQLNISNETKDKLKTWKPTTIGAALRIPGITPASIFILMRHLKFLQANSARKEEDLVV